MSEEPKSFDVAPPGRKPVSHTSRPVIVGRSDHVKDPMVRDQSETSVDDAPSLAQHSEITIAPPASAIPPETEAKPEAHATEPAVSEPMPEVDKPEIVSSFNEDIREPAPLEKKEEPVDDHAQQLIESKAYQLPIKHNARQSFTRVVLVILCVVAIGAIIGYFVMKMLSTGGV